MRTGNSRPDSSLLLCVADEEVAGLMQMRLEETGCSIDIAHDGGEGVAIYDPARHDMLIVEYRLPVYNGLELVQLLATRGVLPPTVMLLDGDEEQIASIVPEFGIDDYVVKDPQQRYLDLLPAIIEHIQRKRRLTAEKGPVAVKSRSVQAGRQEQQVLTETLRWASTVTLSTYINYDEVLDQIIERVGRVMPHDAACLMLVEGDSARVARWRGYRRFKMEGAIATATFPITDVSCLLKVQKTGRPLVVPYAESDDDWLIQSGQHWVKSYLTIPIGTFSSAGNSEGWEMEKLICFLNVDSEVPGFFKQADAERLQAFANQAAIALENARLYDESRRTIIDRVRALKKERNFISTILETASALIIILNPRGRILRFNRTCEKVTGYSANEVRGKQIWDLFVNQTESAKVRAYFETLAQKELLPYSREGYWTTKSGERRLIAWSDNVLLASSGEPEYIISTGVDITERKQMEEALRASEERYALIALSANDGLWDWNLETNEVYFSSRWKAMLGYREDQIGHSPIEWLSRVHPEDLDRLKADIAAHLEERSAPFQNEHRLFHRNGSYRWVVSQGLAVWDENGRPYRMAGSLTDITQRKMTEEKLIYRAFHDALTGLPNRVLFRERLERAIERIREDSRYLFAVLFLDLDRFKVINDNLGHTIGDQLLVEIGRRLKDRTRSSDMVARLGGDEFAILLEGIGGDSEAVQIAEQIQDELARPVELGNHKLFVTTSIGIALSTIGYDWPEEILRDADMAMYQAKVSGRDRHELFRIGMRTDAVAVWQMEASLRQTVEQQEFRLYYQPIVSLSSGQITAVEALLRWEHPLRGFIPPAEFIPLAEEIGLIDSISTWLLHTACGQATEWHRVGYDSLGMSVDLFPSQLQQCAQVKAQSASRCSLPELVENALLKTGLAANALTLEIAENPKMFNNEVGLPALTALDNLGVSIAVDNFGIGSSLDFLKHFPIDTLKIGQSFVTDMIASNSDQTFVTAILAMARSLEVKVVAQGVVNQEQVAFLQSQGCHEAQGDLFSPPLSAEDLTELLRTRRSLSLDTQGSQPHVRIKKADNRRGSRK